MNRRTRILQSPKIIQKKRKKNIIITLLISFCVIIFLSAFILFLRLPFLQITNIEIDGVETLNTNPVNEKILGLLEGNYLYFIPKTNSIFYPKTAIQEQLLGSYVVIDSLSINRQGLHTLHVTIKEKQPVALLCNGFYTSDSEDIAQQKCYFSDKHAFIYREAPSFSIGVYPRYFIAIDENKSIIGSQFLYQLAFDNLQNIFKSMTEAKITPQGLLLKDDGDYELYINNIDTSYAVVYFTSKEPFTETFSNLIAFWNDALKNKKATTTPSFEYIDMRFGNNIFYVTK